MFDLKLDKNGDLFLDEVGDIATTDSIVQAVRIRLLWFFNEWRLGPDLGLPYFEEVLLKNPNETKIKHLIREQVMSVTGVTDVTEITISIDKRTREAVIAVTFTTDEDSYREEVKVAW